MSDLQFELTDVDPQYFFSRDNLNSLKSSFPKIKLVQRGQTIKALGEKTELKEFDKKFRSLLNYYSEYNSIDPNIINDIVVKDIKYNGDKPSLILYGISGKPILAKTVNQKKLHNSISSNDLVFAVGPAGTGKTFLSMAFALSSLEKNEVDRIILCRPAVEAGENLGFLPGDLKDKVDPYLSPLYDALDAMLPKNKLKIFIEHKKIEIVPLAYMRGRTLDNAYMILDEAQNSTVMQMKMFLTRLGIGSKAIINGDVTQIDLDGNKHSGLIQATKILKNVSGIGFTYFDDSDIVRHPLVKKIIGAYDTVEKN